MSYFVLIGLRIVLTFVYYSPVLASMYRQVYFVGALAMHWFYGTFAIANACTQRAGILCGNRSGLAAPRHPPTRACLVRMLWLEAAPFSRHGSSSGIQGYVV